MKKLWTLFIDKVWAGSMRFVSGRCETVFTIHPTSKDFRHEVVTKITKDGVDVINGMSGSRFVPWKQVFPQKLVYFVVIVTLYVLTQLGAYLGS